MTRGCGDGSDMTPAVTVSEGSGYSGGDDISDGGEGGGGGGREDGV